MDDRIRKLLDGEADKPKKETLQAKKPHDRVASGNPQFSKSSPFAKNRGRKNKNPVSGDCLHDGVLFWHAQRESNPRPAV